MTPIEITTTIAGAITALGGGYFFRHWVNEVNNTLKEVTHGLHEHLIQEESVRGEMRLIEEHIRLSNDLSRELLTEIKTIREEQVRVKIELATVATKMENPWGVSK